MTIAVEETVESGLASIGDSNRAAIEYICVSDSPSDTEQDCDSQAFNGSPIKFRGYPRRSLSGETKRMHPTVIRIVRVEYGFDQQQTPLSNPDGSLGSEVSQFDTTHTFNLIGGTELIKTAIATRSYAGTNPVVDVQKTIGLDLKSGQVRGVNIFAPVMDFTLTTEFSNSVVTDDYIDLLMDLTGTTNKSTWRRRPPGSVLFKGARGSKRGDERWQIGFEFAYSKDKPAGINVGGIITGPKKGWEYLDVMYKEGTVDIGGQPIWVPAQVNIHQVYEEEEFSQLKIGP